MDAPPQMRSDDVDEETNRLSGLVVHEAFHVHHALGPGLYEWVYEECLSERLRGRGVATVRQVFFPALFEGKRLESAFRVDLDVGARVLVELKATTRLEPAHFAQLRTYLKMSGREVGILINFHSPRLIDGLHRVALRRAVLSERSARADG